MAQRLVPGPILATLVPLAILAIASWRTGAKRLLKSLWITALVASPLLVGAGIHRLDWGPRHRIETYLVAATIALLAALLAGAIRARPTRREQSMPLATVNHDRGSAMQLPE